MNYYMAVLKNYAGFEGRARRSEFWYFFLINFLISTVLNVIGGAIGFEFLGAIYGLAVLVPYIAVGVRRMHDVGKSGWFLLIPIYNIILAATEGESGENEYGVDPKA